MFVSPAGGVREYFHLTTVVPKATIIERIKALQARPINPLSSFVYQIAFSAIASRRPFD
jgi:hypothetical protein